MADVIPEGKAFVLTVHAGASATATGKLLFCGVFTDFDTYRHWKKVADAAEYCTVRIEEVDINPQPHFLERIGMKPYFFRIDRDLSFVDCAEQLDFMSRISAVRKIEQESWGWTGIIHATSVVGAVHEAYEAVKVMKEEAQGDNVNATTA